MQLKIKSLTFSTPQALENHCVKSIDSATIIILSFGALAQLVERNNGIVEANGSTPLRSILINPYSYVYPGSPLA